MKRPIFRIRASHLRNAPYAVLVDGLPLATEGGLLARFASMKAARIEANRQITVFGRYATPCPVEGMPGVEVFGYDKVLASSGAN